MSKKTCKQQRHTVQCKSALFDEFKVKYGVQNTTSSPHHQQANGAVESAVRVSKHILKQEDPFHALMAYRATPIPATGKTISELIMGRQIRTTVQTMAKVLEPKLPNHATVKNADAKAKRDYKESFDRRIGTRELPSFQPGDWVRTKLDNEKQWTTEAKVVSKDQSPRSYIIHTGSRMLRRNRRFLRKVLTPTCFDTPEDDSLIPDISSESTPNCTSKIALIELNCIKLQ